MPVRIVVIAEAPADQRHVCALIDRKVLHHAPDWLDAEQLEHERVWCGLRPGTAFSRWSEIPVLAKEVFGPRALVPIGFRDDRPRHFDYPSTRKVLLLCQKIDPPPDAILLIRDLDKQADERRQSIELARDEMARAGKRIVLALPKVKREAWVLNGFEPENDAEEKAFAEVRADLGFDPCQGSEQLDAMEKGAKRDAKRVVHLLTGGAAEREERCWANTPWEVLRKRGQGSGLGTFLDEAKVRLLPLMSESRSRRND